MKQEFQPRVTPSHTGLPQYTHTHTHTHTHTIQLFFTFRYFTNGNHHLRPLWWQRQFWAQPFSLLSLFFSWHCHSEQLSFVLWLKKLLADPGLLASLPLCLTQSPDTSVWQGPLCFYCWLTCHGCPSQWTPIGHISPVVFPTSAPYRAESGLMGGEVGTNQKYTGKSGRLRETCRLKESPTATGESIV